MKGTKHCQIVKQATLSVPVSDNTKLLFAVSQKASNQKSEDAATVDDESAGHCKETQATVTTAAARGLVTVATKSDVLSAELLWALKMCSAQYCTLLVQLM